MSRTSPEALAVMDAAVLSAIRGGASRRADIEAASGLTGGALHATLKRLVRTGRASARRHFKGWNLYSTTDR